MRILFAFLAVLLLSEPTLGQICPTCPPMAPLPTYRGYEQQYPMVCEVTVRGQAVNGMRADSKGSGVYVIDEGVPMILTASHLFRDNPSGAVFARFPSSGQSIQGTLVARDETADAAVVRLVAAPRVTPAVVAPDQPSPGEKLTLTGYAASTGFMAQTCTALRVANGGTAVYASAVSRQGCSGGPVWNSQGQVCGLVVGHNTQETLVVTGRRRCGLLRWLIPTRQTVIRQTTTQRPMLVCPPEYAPPSYAPSTAAPPTRPQAPDTAVAPATEPEIDYDRIVAEVMKQISDKLPSKPETVDYERIAALTVARLREDPSFRGPQGPQGPVGPPGTNGMDGTPGRDGRDGSDGTSPTLDIDALAAAIKAQIPGITVRTVDGQGSVLDTEYIPLGGTLNIHHRTK